MTLTTLTDGEPWMTPSERDLNRDLIHALVDFLAAKGVPETTFIALRVNDLAVTWILSRRLETALTPTEGEPPPCPTPAQAGAIGKSRERLRRAMKDLEACFPKTDAPVVDLLHHAIQNAREAGFSPDATGDADHTNQPTENLTPESPGNPPQTTTQTEQSPTMQIPIKYPQATVASAPKPRPRKYRPEIVRPNPKLRATRVANDLDTPSATDRAPDTSRQPNSTPPQDSG